MNIGIAVHRFDPTEGTGRYAVELVARLARRHDVTVYATAVRGTVPGGVTFLRVPALTGSATATIMTFPLGFRLVRKPHDVLHAQGWVTGRADVATAHIVMAGWRRAARAAGVPAPPGERVLGWFIERRERALLGRRARHVIAPSRTAADQIARHYDRRAEVTVIPHGFPAPGAATLPADEARAALGLPGYPLIALYVGDPRKGLRAAYRAVARTTGVHLAVASHTPRKRLERLAHDLDVAERVTILGRLDDMTPAYAAADVLLHPTIYDTFGLAVAEAMAHGVPPVVTRAAGIAELITHAESGWIVDDPAPDRLADALTVLRADAGLRDRLRDGARRVAASRSWDAVARETEAVYEQLA